MIGTLRRTFLPLGLALALGLGLAAPIPAAHACPFCSMQGKTLTGEVSDAAMVLYGSLANAKLTGGPNGEGSTDLVIESVIKPNDILNDSKVVHTVGDKKVLILDRYVPEDKKFKFLVFCDVFKGKVDPYRGMAVKADSDLEKYLSGALKIKEKDVGTRLKFFFEYLDNDDSEINTDAYKEFANADYKDYHEMAKTLPAEKIAAWLKSEKTPSFRYGLYASMLGHCGTDAHARLLREMLDNPDKRLTSGVDGILAGYIMLKPQEGWEYLRGIMKDSTKEFTLRYAGLRAARFIWDYRSEGKDKLVDRKSIVDGICLLLDQNDIADLAIEDLRKWGQWDVSDRILSLYGKKSHDIPIIRRSILRYALCCGRAQGDSKAAQFVADIRTKNPQMVKDAEELLKLEGGAK